jgi:glycosyltransferase involved in cell wall biosynthesis
MNKIEVVYSAIKLHRAKPIIRKKGTINILFIGGAFEAKGGRKVLAAFKKLQEKMLNLLLLKDLKKEYLKSIKGLNIEAYTSLSRGKILNEIYPKADIFVMPSFMDAVSYVYLEAMSFSIPISLWKEDESYNPNFWESLNEVEYFEEVAKAIADAMRMLIENFELRLKMGMNGIQRVLNGPVSITTRNSKHKEIYEKYLF